MWLPYIAIAPFLLRAASAATCTTNRALQVAESISASASPSCSEYLASKHTNIVGLPKTLSTYIFNTAQASSVCSCLLGQTTATTTMTNSPATCPTSIQTITSTVTTTSGGVGSTQTTTTTITTGASVSTTTLTSISTVTATAAPSKGAVDQSGCPAVNGDTAFEFTIYCDSTAGSGSFQYATNPGYNIEDCASQCYDNFGNGDCLGVVYVPPSPAFNVIDEHLMPGTCQFYEFVTSAVASPGNVLGVFDNAFARRRKRSR